MNPVKLFLHKPEHNVKGEYHLSVGDSPKTVCNSRTDTEKMKDYIPHESTIPDVLNAYKSGKLCRKCATMPKSKTRTSVVEELRRYMWWTQGASL